MTLSLQEAIRLARTGQKDAARVFFMKIIQQNPRDETAWLWLSDCLPDDRTRIQAFETCLRFNPDSHRARMALDMLLTQTSSGGQEDTAGTSPSLSPKQPAQAEPPALALEKPLPQAADFEIKGEISSDFLDELEEEPRPVERTPSVPIHVPIQTFEIQDEPQDEPIIPEPAQQELSAEDQLVQSLRKPKRWHFHFPTFSKGRPGRPNPSGSRARRRVIVLLSLVILLIAISAAMLGHPNFQIANLSGVLARFKLPGLALNNPAQGIVETASSPALTPTRGVAPTPMVSATTAQPSNSLGTGQPGAAIALEMDPAAALPRPLSQHSASLLPDGQILLAGGYLHGGGYGYSYLYDPAEGAFTQSGSLLTGRYGQSAVVLMDGRVLVTGGQNLDGDVFTAEIYDQASGAWKQIPMGFDHGKGHTATLLTNGQVLVAGGCTTSGPTNVAELYDPEANSWIKIARMPGNYCNSSATLLADGRVLVVGETPDATAPTAVIYDPGKPGWSPAADLRTPRSSHTATLLPDGRVLVSGGQNTRLGALNSVEVYDPAKDEWTELRAMRDVRFGHAAVLLPDERLVVIGGFSGASGAPLDTVEVYYPGSDAWSEPASLGSGLGAFSATLLPEGKVFLTGGTTDGQNNTDATEMMVVK